MSSAVFGQHLLISLVPWLAGVAVGGVRIYMRPNGTEAILRPAHSA